MKQLKKNSIPRNFFEKGFALISTILIMSLLSLLTLSILSISSIEVKNLQVYSHQQRAQNNARLALQQALGELQAHAGVDQIITANASILDAIDKTLEMDEIKLPYVTGVWNSEMNHYSNEEIKYNERSETNFRRWLISLKNGKEGELDTVKQSLEGAKLVGEGTLGENSDAKHVIAEIIDTPDGGLAWWVGDESLKAKINPSILTEEYTESFDTVYNRTQSAPIPNPVGTESLDWMKLDLDNDFEAQRANIAKFYTQKSVQLYPDSKAKNNKAFHDFTTHSLSIPVNVKEGSLKGDLTRLFAAKELPTEFLSGEVKNYGGTEIKRGVELYETPNDISSAPDWKRLADYHRLSTQVKWDEQVPYIEYNLEDWDELRKLECAPPLPTMIRMQTFYSITIGRNNRYALVIEPVVTLWNPYNVELRISKDAARLVMRSFWQSLQIIVKSGNTVINPTSLHRYLFSPAYPNTNMRFVIDDGLVLKPGEVKVYSDKSTTPLDWNGNRTVWGHELYSVEGWEQKGGFLGDGNGNFGVASPGQSISVDIIPIQSLHSGGNYGQNQTNLYTQMDLIHRPSGLWSPKTYKSFQSFRIKNHSQGQMQELWDDKITRNNISSSSLSGRKIPLCVVDVRARTEEDINHATLPNLFTSNTHGSLLTTTNLVKPMQANTYWTTELRSISDWDTQTVEIDANNRSYFGSGFTAGTGANFVVAKEIPLKPTLNIASYRNFDALFNPKVYDTWGRGDTDPAKHTVHPAASQIIGNSYAHPLLPRDKATADSLDPSMAVEFFDHSYHLNQALFDGWFHSGLSTENLDASSLEAELKSINTGQKQLPNARMLFSTSSNIEDVVRNLEDEEKGYLESAKHCHVDGAFNVNSTSLDAWKTILHSLRGQKLATIDVLSGTVSQEYKDIERTPFPRFISPTGKDADTSLLDNQNLWAGFRSLSDEDIDSLAEHIVEQVKIRGPFFSMSDFVNRRLSSTKQDSLATKSAKKPYDLSLKASLQTAIDETMINERMFKVEQNAGEVDGVGYPNPDAAKGLRAAGASGYLSQGDLLQALGAILTVRGDTFVIRAYGESRDSAGNVQAGSWCEAVVQRSHEFVSPKNTSEKKYSELNPTNQLFGRKFHIMSFRWLNSDEI